MHSRLGHAQSLHSKGLLKDVNFGSQLQQKLDQLGTDGSDVLSQLAGMLQAGTPLATIIDRVAKAVSNALASATGNDGNTDRRRTLERALAAALAPPGTSPPKQSGLEQAASLEQRLGDILSKVTRELKNAGQQNRFSGAVLDAGTAREIPAQQQTKETTGTKPPAGSLALAESILRSVVQQLHAVASHTAPQTAQVPAAQVPAAQVPAAQVPAAQVPAPESPHQITTHSADVLGRMLARAANADAQHSQQAPAPAALAATAPAVRTHAAPSSSASTSPSEVFARLTNVIAQASNERTAHEGGKQPQEFAFGKNALPAMHQSLQSAPTASTPAFAAAMTNATASAARSPLPATPYALDPQSVIEQVVKGIVLRNFGSTSEVRMRLQPEHLGDVSLKLTVTGNTISANIVAQNADVRDMLVANQQQLARSLAEAGLSLGKFSVDVSGGNPGFSQQQSQQHRSLSKAGALRMSALAEDDTWADPRFGPPVLTGAKSWVLNYLA